MQKAREAVAYLCTSCLPVDLKAYVNQCKTVNVLIYQSIQGGILVEQFQSAYKPSHSMEATLEWFKMIFCKPLTMISV